MIRFECPECERPFKVADEHAGKSIRCPGCKSVLTVPVVEAEGEEEAPSPPPRKSTRSVQPADDAPVRRKPKLELDEEDDRPRRRRDTRKEDDDEEEERPRKKKKKKKEEDTTDTKLFIALALGLSILFVLMTGLSFWFKGAAFVMLVLGIVPVGIGTWWISAIAHEEGELHYFACRFVPFYDTWYSLTRWGQTWGACLMCWIGRVFAVTAIVFLVIHTLNEKSSGGWPGGGRGLGTPAEMDAECVRLLKAPDASEARMWMAVPGRRIQEVTVGQLPLRQAVDGLYQQGAVRVTFAEIHSDEEVDDPMHLIIELPGEKDKRQTLFNHVNGRLLDPDDARQSDRGQKYLLILTN